MRVTILDYGVGNLHSLAKAIAAAGAEPIIVGDASAATRAEALVLPGVGAFAPAAARLAAAREPLRAAILAGMPTLGICLGMQLMFDASDEGAGAGLGVFAGRVTRLTSQAVPQIGWNALDAPTERLLVESGLREVYYANSFACRADDPAIVGAWSEHEEIALRRWSGRVAR